MPRLPQALATGLVLALVAACTDSDKHLAAMPDPAAAPVPEAKPAQEAQDIVVTGSSRGITSQQVSGTPVTVLSSASVASAPMARTRGYVAQPEPRPASPYYRDTGRDKFTATQQNAFKIVREEPVSTFSLDVDTASYSFVRASLNQNVLPQPAAVRTEEMVNYFPYDYAPARTAEQPFSTSVAVFPSPWSPGRKLVRIGVKGYEIQRATRPRANLVFLIDTSGSMNEPSKLPLVKRSLAMLLDQLDGKDSVAIVTYAGQAGTALEPTPASSKDRILAVIDRLGAGGSTAGAEGIRQAYALAEQNFDPKGVNRVILATDGDFNVGITSDNELKGYVERERGKGVFLSVLGFGMGNYNDALMQALAQNGNGAAAYIDTIGEARKTLVDEATSTLFPIAKDVKIQVEFNPGAVSEYRLIGYETRMLNRDDFDNDKVDAGDVGSGQTVTAIYEVTPVGGPRAIGDLRYAEPAPAAAAGQTAELGFVKIRYKLPKSDTSRLITTPIDRETMFARFEDAPRDARFAATVAGFAELLRGGRYNGRLSFDDVLGMASAARGEDDFGYRSEFLQLVRAAKTARSMAALEQ
ncbi:MULTISPECIES: VWA domain-containing protein [unclassified Sphingomonas]|jgi:Ca-activated chloride channel homolog|nr:MULTISPECIES: VWA domain-containing protein [unclassified Sphingomonas]